MPETTPSRDNWNERTAAVWARADSLTDEALLAAIEQLASEARAFEAEAFEAGAPDFEQASALDYLGRESEAEPLYRRAIELGLDPERAAQAAIQLASTLRGLDRASEAIALLEELLEEHPADEWTSPAAAFLALSLSSAGRDREAASVALVALSRHLPTYAGAVSRYAMALRR